MKKCISIVLTVVLCLVMAVSASAADVTANVCGYGDSPEIPDGFLETCGNAVLGLIDSMSEIDLGAIDFGAIDFDDIDFGNISFGGEDNDKMMKSTRKFPIREATQPLSGQLLCLF